MTLASVASEVAGAQTGGPEAAKNEAWTMFSRLNGVPPAPAKLAELQALIEQGDRRGAAMAAIDDTGGRFYNLFLKNWIARWTNADKTPRVPLNDFTATVIGMIRDGLPFDQVLYGDIIYTGNVPNAPAYALANNNHYAFLETNNARLHQVLQRRVQSAVTGIPPAATAGVLTTRGFAEAYYQAGTNRRAVRFTAMNFLCRDMEQLSDPTRSDFRVRQDVSRAPAGEAATYTNKCAGCHAGMDGLAGAFSFFDFENGALIYAQGRIPAKVLRNSQEFPTGYQTTDDSWVNLWTAGPNSDLGWKGPSQGSGPKSLGEHFAKSDAFAQCMAGRALSAVCLTDEGADLSAERVTTLATSFKSGGYNMKNLFADAAAACAEGK